MFFRHREHQSYDSENLRPVIRVSICTGEETAGFKDRKSGKFHEVQLIRSVSDLQGFMDRYGLQEEPPREY